MRSRDLGLGRELPRVPRRYGQWAAAALFVVVSLVVAGWLWQSKSDRQEVLAVAHPVPAGSVITRSDLTVEDVGGLKGGISAPDSRTVVGRTAAVGMVPGQILTPGMLATKPLPGPGQRVVGVELDAGRAPTGLAPGDVVEVLAVPPSGDASSPAQLSSPNLLADDVTVISVVRIEGAGTRLELLVEMAMANQVAAFGAAGRVALVQAPLGGDS